MITEALIAALAGLGLKFNDEMPFEGHCDFCGKQGDKATRQQPKGITFLNPDFKWLCESCLQNKMQREAVGAAIRG